jgi:hypothetical protein
MQNNEPIWMDKPQQKASDGKPVIFLATPVHSECSIHYAQSLLQLQQECFIKGIVISFTLLKSSLVTQGRNLCVANFFNEPTRYTHLFFVDSDIEFTPETLFKLIAADKDIIAAPYPMKTIDWNKMSKRSKQHNISDMMTLSKLGYTWPVKMERGDQIVVKEGVAEVSHVPTGCTLYKREVLEKMIKAYPDRKIHQPTIINGREHTKENYYNLFDTYHDPKNKRYYGEDFGFCKRWAEIGGKCHILIGEEIAHIGEYRYSGKISNDLQLAKVDLSNKNK